MFSISNAGMVLATSFSTKRWIKKSFLKIFKVSKQVFREGAVHLPQAKANRNKYRQSEIMQILKSATSQSFTARWRDANCCEKDWISFYGYKNRKCILFTLLNLPKYREEKVYSKIFQIYAYNDLSCRTDDTKHALKILLFEVWSKAFLFPHFSLNELGNEIL